jgi:tricorn protease
MTRLRIFLALTVLALLAAAARAQEPIRFARMPDISPDGKLVAFSYLGDIWVVEAIGGIARPVTMHEAHDAAPLFSPDGRQIAFSSNRYGSYDVFVTSVEGGRPRRLTYDSAADVVNCWAPDGKSLLFASTRSTAFPPTYGLYTVPVEGGRVKRVGVPEGKEAVYSPSGDRIAYVRGAGTWYRRGYRGSSNDDIWICHADGTNNRRLTNFNGEDNSPMWSADGRYVYYVSECCAPAGGRSVANIVRQDAAGKSKPEQVTFHKDESVRRGRISRDGNWIVYECGADLYLVGTRPSGPPPRKLAIEVHADDKANTDRLLKVDGRGMSEFSLSNDERHVAFVVHGQLFMMPTTGGKAVRLTESNAYDHGANWSPDGRKIVFASDRNGQEDLYLLESDEPDQKDLTKAHKFKAKQLTNTPDAEFGASFAPDGRHIAFIRAGKLWIMEPDGSGQKPLVDQVQVIDYDWSPDGKWVVYSRMDGALASELYIIPSDPALAKLHPAHNVTRYATYNSDVTWSANGKKIAFISLRRNQVGLFVLSLERPAAPGAPTQYGVHIDWEDIHLRAEQPIPLATDEGCISHDGSKVAFRAGPHGGDLWVASTTGGHVTRVTNGNLGPQQIQWSKRGDLLYFRDVHGALHLARPALGEAPVPFRVKMRIRRDEEFGEMFEQSWRALRDYFYDPKFHGTDWYAVRAKYRPLVKHVALKEDLYALISIMMGELNASHMGISGFLSAPEETTADLGVLFDESYRGPGLKVAEVLKRGPADRRGINLKAGDVIRAIDRETITANTNLSRLLNDKIGETVQLQVTSNPAADPVKDRTQFRTVEVQGASRSTISELMYERWVDHNTRRVAELSKGRVGYIHIPSMDEEGLDRFVRALYSDNNDKDAIVLDVRYNGGGFTHDQILNYLGGKEHTIFRQRDGGEGHVLRSFDRKWSKPLVLLINSRSYSDAEIFPSAFRSLGLGKLVGQPTGGHVIGTSTVRLIDGTHFRIPRIGVYTTKDVDMEGHGVTPDVLVEQTPDQEARGQDPQLDKAVEVVGADVLAWKRHQEQVAAKPPRGVQPVVGSGPSPVKAPMGK